MRQSLKLAFCGVVSALSLALMFMALVIPALSYTLPAVCGMLLMAVAAEINRRAAFAVYICVDILGFILSPEKSAVILYILFFGYYPILKSLIEKISARVLEWAIKILVFNAAAVAVYYTAALVLTVSNDFFGLSGSAAMLLLLGMLNIAFVLYDVALTKLAALYMLKFHPKIGRFLK